MDWIDFLQWPAMVVTVAAAWLVASRASDRRKRGFYVYVASNLLWSAWGWYTGAWALIALQVALFLMNLRGARKNQGGGGDDEAAAGEPRRARALTPAGRFTPALSRPSMSPACSFASIRRRP